MKRNVAQHTLCHSVKPAGFTLMELMIAVVIVGILAAVALPSYNSYLVKSRRTAAQGYLMDVAQRQQQYLSDTRTYAQTVAALNMTEPGDVSSYYTIKIDVATTLPPAFVVTASPKVGTPQATDAVLTLNNQGAKTPEKFW